MTGEYKWLPGSKTCNKSSSYLRGIVKVPKPCVQQSGGPVGSQGGRLRVEVRDLVREVIVDAKVAVEAVVLRLALEDSRRDDNVLHRDTECVL